MSAQVQVVEYRLPYGKNMETRRTVPVTELFTQQGRAKLVREFALALEQLVPPAERRQVR